MTAAEARELIADGAIDAGMIPKVEACLETLERGVQKIHIIDGRLRHSLLLEIYTSKGVGTEIVRESEAEREQRIAAADCGYRSKFIRQSEHWSHLDPTHLPRRNADGQSPPLTSPPKRIELFKQYVVPNYNRFPVAWSAAKARTSGTPRGTATSISSPAGAATCWAIARAGGRGGAASRSAS